MHERLTLELERFFRTGEGDFESLALDLFGHQFESNQPYRAFCLAQGITPSTVTKWEDIPAVPIRAFKSSVLATFPTGRAAAEFRSSGTTGSATSRHYLRTLSFYEAALRWGFSHAVLPDRAIMPFLILAPSPAEAPHSSLSWMLEVVLRKWRATGGGYFMRRGRLDDILLMQTLAKMQQAGEPVTLLGTTLGFLGFFDACAQQGRHFLCARGSRLMDTGGMKTETREVTRQQFIDQVSRVLGIPEEACINEYGMCEMSSQFYASGASPLFKGPPWVRTRVIDPVTGAAVAVGQQGLLQHYDLANVDSVMAILTEDRGEAKAEGFVFLGRATDAELKGCSLAAEAYLKP